MTRRTVLAAAIGAMALAACNPDVEQTSGTGTAPLNRGEVNASNELVAPVVIGESGPRFNACQATGVIRSVAGDGTLPVRAAPFDEAREVTVLTNGDAVFVCTRSHDQRWLGVVFSDGRELAGVCGVSAPVPSRRPYDGPCESGWVSSAFVQLGAN